VLGAGALTGKYSAPDGGKGRANRTGPIDERRLRLGGIVAAVAAEAGCTPSQAAIAWVRQQPGVIVPILGARTAEQLRDNLGCLDVTLSPEQLSRLEEASRIDLGFPHDFLSRPSIRELIYGGTYDQIRKHRG